MLTVGDAQNLESIRSGTSQVEVVLSGNVNRTKSGLVTRRRCTQCSKYGHNVRTCKNKEEELEDFDSDNS